MEPIVVQGFEGLRGTLSKVPSGDTAELCLEDGRRVQISAGALERRADGTWFLPLRPADLTATHYDSADASAVSREVVERIPVIEEQVDVGKERVETGRVRVHVVPQVRKEVVDVDLSEERVEVERVPVDRIVERAEASRQEGDVTVIPVYEEVLVCEKRLRLKEEVRIRRVSTVQHARREVELRREEVEVVRSAHPGTEEPPKPKDVRP